MRKRKNNGWRALLTTVMACAVLFYVSYQAYRSMYSSVDTELAVLQVYAQTVDLWLFRFYQQLLELMVFFMVLHTLWYLLSFIGHLVCIFVQKTLKIVYH